MMENTAYDPGLRPSAELEMMMDRRHLENTLSASLFKIGYLNDNR